MSNCWGKPPRYSDEDILLYEVLSRELGIFEEFQVLSPCALIHVSFYRLMRCNFGVMQRLGDSVMRPFLQVLPQPQELRITAVSK